MKRSTFVLVLAGALVWGTTTYAHHSFSGTYDKTKQVKLEGKLVRVLFRNPHSFIHVEAPDANGQMQVWSVEWSGGTQLSRSNINRDTLKVGDPVTITGNPSRTPGQYRLLMLTFKRTSDGLSWGGAPREQVD